jgi:hypothetical protein
VPTNEFDLAGVRAPAEQQDNEDADADEAVIEVDDGDCDEVSGEAAWREKHAPKTIAAFLFLRLW